MCRKDFLKHRALFELWCLDVFALCIVKLKLFTALTPDFLLTRKGPIERVSFPAANSNVSPFQHIATYIMILGQKIDSAQTFKVGNQFSTAVLQIGLHSLLGWVPTLSGKA